MNNQHLFLKNCLKMTQYYSVDYKIAYIAEYVRDYDNHKSRIIIKETTLMYINTGISLQICLNIINVINNFRIWHLKSEIIKMVFAFLVVLLMIHKKHKNEKKSIINVCRNE